MTSSPVSSADRRREKRETVLRIGRTCRATIRGAAAAASRRLMSDSASSASISASGCARRRCDRGSISRCRRCAGVGGLRSADGGDLGPRLPSSETSITYSPTNTAFAVVAADRRARSLENTTRSIRSGSASVIFKFRPGGDPSGAELAVDRRVAARRRRRSLPPRGWRLSVACRRWRRGHVAARRAGRPDFELVDVKAGGDVGLDRRAVDASAARTGLRPARSVPSVPSRSTGGPRPAAFDLRRLRFGPGRDRFEFACVRCRVDPRVLRAV